MTSEDRYAFKLVIATIIIYSIYATIFILGGYLNWWGGSGIVH